MNPAASAPPASAISAAARPAAAGPQALPVPPELLRRLDATGPRYTSYPTADRFVDTFGPAEYRQALRARAAGPGRDIAGARPLSLYVHLPFCERLCHYCACNKVVTRNHDRAGEYLAALQCEIDLHLAELGPGQPVAQLHLGGGSPTFLSDAELARLLDMLRRAFAIAPGAEIAVEVDPRTVDRQRLRRLAALGVGRLSFGVQDFDPQVQRAVHRVQAFDQVRALVEAAREFGFRSTNLDLIYGLPRQTPESFARTVAQVRALRPDRIALYAYAHLPQRFKPQRRIDPAALPSAEHRLGMMAQAIAGFAAEGYDHIGMDHFALPGDALAVARRQGRLRRDFQGYGTGPDGDLIGLGVSAIGRVGASYSQNARDLRDYYDALRQGGFATARGLSATRDDLARRSVIMALMCQGRVDYGSVGAAHLVDVRSAFAAEIDALRPMADDGLVALEAGAIEVTPLGRHFVRAIAMVFDRHLRTDRAQARFSRIV